MGGGGVGVGGGGWGGVGGGGGWGGWGGGGVGVGVGAQGWGHSGNVASKGSYHDLVLVFVHIIIMHFKWANDFILTAITAVTWSGLHRQIDGSQEVFCTNLAAVDEIKIKYLAFKKIETARISFNKKVAEHVIHCKFLGNICPDWIEICRKTANTVKPLDVAP